MAGTDPRQALYLIADQMRGIATAGRQYAANVYEAERAERLMGLAADVAALADDATPESVRAHFLAEPWLRFSPAIGADAAVFDDAGRILLVRPNDGTGWAMPGGLAEIGETPTEAVLRELWEEAGLRGRAMRLLGLFDARRWGSRARVHLVHLVFLVECEEILPTPGVEVDEIGFFAADRLPSPMRPGHGTRVPKVFEMAHGTSTFFDPAASYDVDLPMHQRPDAT